MTSHQAELLTGFIWAVIVPFVVSFIKRCQWPDIYKVLLALFVSAIGGGLTTLAGGQMLGLDGDWVTTGLTIWGAATVFYHTAFKGLGFERYLNPPTIDPGTRDIEAIIKEVRNKERAITYGPPPDEIEPPPDYYQRTPGGG